MRIFRRSASENDFGRSTSPETCKAKSRRVYDWMAKVLRSEELIRWGKRSIYLPDIESPPFGGSASG